MMDEESVSRQHSTTERALTPSMVQTVRAERSRTSRVLIGIGIGVELLLLTLAFCATWRDPATPSRLFALVMAGLIPVITLGVVWLMIDRGYRRVLRSGRYLRIVGPARIVERHGQRGVTYWHLETSAGTYVIDRCPERTIPWATIDLIPTSGSGGSSAMALRIEDDRGRVVYWHPNYRPTAGDIPPA